MKQTSYSKTLDACKKQAKYFSYKIYGSVSASIYVDDNGHYVWVPGNYDKYDGYEIVACTNII